MRKLWCTKAKKTYKSSFPRILPAPSPLCSSVAGELQRVCRRLLWKLDTGFYLLQCMVPLYLRNSVREKAAFISTCHCVFGLVSDAGPLIVQEFSYLCLCPAIQKTVCRRIGELMIYYPHYISITPRLLIIPTPKAILFRWSKLNLAFIL